MLFIHNDAAKAAYRQKEGGPCAYDNAGRFFAGHLPEGGFPAHLALVAMVKDDVGGRKRLLAVLSELVGKRHLRGQEQHGGSLIKGRLHNLDIDCRLAGSCHAKEQPLGRLFPVQQGNECRDCLLLVFCQREGKRACRLCQQFLQFLAPPVIQIRLKPDKAGPDQCLHHGGAARTQFPHQGPVVGGPVQHEVFKALYLLLRIGTHRPGRRAGQNAALASGRILPWRQKLRPACDKLPCNFFLEVLR